MRWALLLFVIAVAGCYKAPAARTAPAWHNLTVDGTSDTTFRQSVAAIHAELDPEERKQFDVGMQVVCGVSLKAPSVAAGPGPAPQSVLEKLHGKTARDLIVSGKLQLDMLKMIEAQIEALDAQAKRNAQRN